MLKKLSLTVLGLLLLAGALVGTKMQQFRAMGEAGANMVPPPEVVTAAPVRADEWENTLTATGTLVAVQGVTVRAEVSGRVVRIAFESGTAVEAGQVLVQLDVSSEQAQLRAAEAAAALARANLARARDLHRSRNMSQAELDAAEAQFEGAAAQVETIRAAIAKKTVRAPFSGRLGIRQVDLGAVLAEGDAIVSLQTLDPIYVEFTLPQRSLGALELGTRVRVTTDAAAGEVYAGGISAVSPEVDATTRNVRVQATIANRGEKLRAGMFANVEVVLPVRQQVLAVPATAVLFAPFGDSVFVIEERAGEPGAEPELYVGQRFVRLGRQRGDFVAVVEGLEAGEQVVSSGVFKLRSGVRVVIDNSLAPKAELSPRPDNI
ncbi:MAG: efflux RND transporter periplasmic adaptor subunit [Gammaproteobacteria bacterium]|nr:efflux RND transporter periplasmic adaptor subunit [Gammaproteobacteria bacterium]